MTRRHALQILIDHAARDVAGVGCGIRPALSERARREVRDATIRVWADAYTFPCDDGVLSNLGLPLVEAQEKDGRE